MGIFDLLLHTSLLAHWLLALFYPIWVNFWVYTRKWMTKMSLVPTREFLLFPLQVNSVYYPCFGSGHQRPSFYLNFLPGRRVVCSSFALDLACSNQTKNVFCSYLLDHVFTFSLPFVDQTLSIFLCWWCASTTLLLTIFLVMLVRWIGHIQLLAKFCSLGLGGIPPTKTRKFMPAWPLQWKQAFFTPETR